MAGVTLDGLHIVILIGAAQGVALAGALLTRSRNRTANRLMAAAMLAFSVYLLWEDYYWAGLVERYPHLFGISYPLPWVFGPLIYLYSVTASDRTRGFLRRDLVHFVPPLVVVLATLPIYMMDAAGKIALFHQLEAGVAPKVIMLLEPTKYVSGLGYTLAMVLHLRRHRRRIEDSYSNPERVNLGWLMWMTGLSAAVWLLATGVVAARLIAGVPEQGGLVALSVALVVYAIGYMSLRQPEIFRFETAEFPVPEGARAESVVPAPAPEPAPLAEASRDGDAARYERSGLSDREAERLQARLLELMDREQPWRDSDLTLADLAGRVDATPHNLSEVLNAKIGQTFYDFVNGYRVREVQRRIAKGEARALKMLSLALDAGFASKSTFNQVFKKHTHLTPSDYREAAKA